MTLKSTFSCSTIRTRKNGDKGKDKGKDNLMEEKHKVQQQLGILLLRNLVMLKRTAKSRMGRR